MSPLFFCIFFSLVCVTLGNAQNETLIDTVNSQFQKELGEYYSKNSLRANDAQYSFANGQAQTQFNLLYQEKRNYFFSLLNKRIFVEDKKYSPFIERIVQDIKKANPEATLDSVKVILSISKESNAYNVGEGIVVVNLPLIGKLENEFQLAYVISHEMAHQKLNHVLNSMVDYVNGRNSKTIEEKISQIEKQKFNKATDASSILKNLLYNERHQSRTKEHQADSLGFVFFNKTYPQHKNQALKTLEILKNIDQVKDSLTKQDYVRIFETPNQKFKEEWLFSDALSNYNYQKKGKSCETDSLRTHPNCDIRKSYLKDKFLLQETDLPLGSLNYTKLINKSGKEYAFGLFFLEEYGKSLYYTLLELKKNPKDRVLRKMLYDNLIKIRAARNSYTLNKYLEMENPKFSDNYNQFLGFVRNLKKNELNEIISNCNYG